MRSDLLKNGEFTWDPEIAPAGPIQVLVSLDEQRAYTYCNGVEIGRTKVQFREPEEPVGTQPRWTKVGMIGHMDDANTLPDADVVNRIILPQDFQQRLTPLLVSGTTMMVTDAPILENTTGQTMAVLSSHPGI